MKTMFIGMFVAIITTAGSYGIHTRVAKADTASAACCDKCPACCTTCGDAGCASGACSADCCTSSCCGSACCK